MEDTSPPAFWPDDMPVARLTFWIITAIFQVLELFGDKLLDWYAVFVHFFSSFYFFGFPQRRKINGKQEMCWPVYPRFPLYYEFKLVCLLILQNDTLRIPTILYKHVVRPTLKPREEDIDAFIAEVYVKMLTYVSKGLEMAVEKGPGFVATVNDKFQLHRTNSERFAHDQQARKAAKHARSSSKTD